MAPRSAGIDFREVCDPYIPIAPETRGPVASLKDARRRARILGREVRVAV